MALRTQIRSPEDRTDPALPTVLSYPLWTLHQYNPYVAIIAQELQKLDVSFKRFRSQIPLRTADAMHVHWPEFVLRSRYARRSPMLTSLCCRNLVATMERVRRNGGQVVWTVHNLRPHEPPPPHLKSVWDHWHPRIVGTFTRLVCLTEAATAQVAQIDPRLETLPTYVAPHPHLRDVYDSFDPPEQTRRMLGIAETDIVVGVIGLLRPYKGVVEIVRQFRSVHRPGERLLIAGDCRDPDYRRELEEACRDCPAIILRLGVLPSHEYASLTKACNGLAHNFSAILNSGSVITSLSLDVRVFAPALGALHELGAQVGADWCSLFQPPLDGRVLREWMDRLTVPPPSRRPNLECNEPAEVGKVYYRAFFEDR